MDIRKLVCIQNETKRKKELCKLRSASSATITFIVLQIDFHTSIVI